MCYDGGCSILFDCFFFATIGRGPARHDKVGDYVRNQTAAVVVVARQICALQNVMEKTTDVISKGMRRLTRYY